MSQQSGREEREDEKAEPLNEEGAGLGLDEEANTFEPEEDPGATEEPGEG